MIRKDFAKQEIGKLWLQWPNTQEKFGNHFGFMFYGWLQRENPELLSFRDTEDKYQTINGWVIGWQAQYKSRS